MIKSFVGPLLITTIIGDFILLMQFFWVYVGELVGKGLEWYIVAELMFYASATFIPMAMPIGVLLASLMVFGNLGEKYELVALKSSGISLNRILRPLIFLVIALAAFAFYFSNNILPKANLKFDSIFYDIRRQKMAFNLTEGVFYNGIEGYVIRVNKKDKDDKTLYGVMVYKHNENRGINDNVTFAQKGYMDVTADGSTLILTLFDGYNYDDSYDKKNNSKQPFKRIEFEREVMNFDLSQFNLRRSDEDIRKNHYRNFNYQQLDHALDSMNNRMAGFVDIYKGLASERYAGMKHIDKQTYWNDTIDTCNLVMPLIDNFKTRAQTQIMSSALDHARNTKAFWMTKLNNALYLNNKIITHQIEKNRRYALAFACIVMFFIGAPLGAIIRKGGLGFPLVISTFVFVLYYIILTSGQKSAMKGEMSPFWGIWLANFIVLPFGAFLTAKSTSDAPMFDKDSWSKFFKRKR
ncbi:MAG: LptF/LptG family permease [Bacteroidales bacterium]|nr:LptF/LptG family permease [Bacteroidales bacterium]